MKCRRPTIEIEGSADKPEAWVVHAGTHVHKSSLVGLAFGRRFTSAGRNPRVLAQHPTPSQPTPDKDASDTDAGSDICAGDMW
jgi:hypothetical protein